MPRRGQRRRRSRYDGFLDVGVWLLFAALLLPAGIVGYAIGANRDGGGDAKREAAAPSPTETPQIEPAPAFSADDLTAEPEDAWLTNGGTLMNQRYSPLDQITTDNVKDLKGEWMIDLDGSGTDAKYSAEAQPIVYQGVMYVPTGADDVFAVRVADGEVIWKYEAKLDQKISTVCCGWLSRGVALGEGMVYLGQLDGTLVALGPEDRQAGLADRGRPLAGRVHDHGRAALLRRARLHGRLGRRVLDPRPRAGLRRRDGRGGLALLHRARARARSATRPGRRTTTPGSTAARRCGRRRRSTPSSA